MAANPSTLRRFILVSDVAPNSADAPQQPKDGEDHCHGEAAVTSAVGGITGKDNQHRR
jgi:hypothetical protein